MKTLAGFTLLLTLVVAPSHVSGLAAAVTETEVTHVDVTPGTTGATGFKFNVSAVVTKMVMFDVTQGQGGYDAFMTQQLNVEVLATTNSRYVLRRPLLGPRKLGGQPDMWVHAVLKSGASTTTLAIRADNLYIVAFKAQDGAWHCFSDAAHQLRTARPLPFAGTYVSLTGGRGCTAMETLPFGRTATQAAVSALAGYKAGGAAISVDQVRQALATLVITFCEAQRFEVVLKNVTATCDNGGYVSRTGVKLLVKWTEISCALIGYQKVKSWSKVPEATEISLLGDPVMKSAAAAVQNIRFVLNTHNCDPPRSSAGPSVCKKTAT